MDPDIREILYKAFCLNRDKTQIPEKSYHTQKDKLADKLQYAIRSLDDEMQKTIIELFRKLL